ncbi:hypothetical protein [Natrinema versiforme]|uniref:Uncharacterized protein n=1 Tax=Natrinema versiforme JCM 10478 TaxID=1227496 RepID=L9Y6P1_9EURY|nr:hypothetical protein [Natrinema versiforme]ELY69321.1 hypothetical protein C489_05188 [Natrinema versiforme JCM 10478]
MSDAERGPNGFPYISPDTSFSTWENGEHCIMLKRKDGKALKVNLKPEQMEGLREAITHHLEHASGEGDEQEGGSP